MQTLTDKWFTVIAALNYKATYVKYVRFEVLALAEGNGILTLLVHMDRRTSGSQKQPRSTEKTYVKTVRFEEWGLADVNGQVVSSNSCT